MIDWQSPKSKNENWAVYDNLPNEHGQTYQFYDSSKSGCYREIYCPILALLKSITEVRQKHGKIIISISHRTWPVKWLGREWQKYSKSR